MQLRFWWRYIHKNVEKVFESLNNNSDDTGIIVIPKIPVYENTIQINGISKSYKNADYWYDNLNEHFNNIIYIQKDRMKGFSLKNVIVDIISNQHDDKIKIGFTPGCNLALDEIMKVRTYCDPNTKEQLFEIQDYYKEELLNKQFLNSLNLAKENDVDILVGSEMFGTSLLCETDEFGFNLQYKDPSSRKPYIIVTPTYWNNRKNYASVFLNSGEQIGLQYKQNGFEYRCNDTKFTENLENTPKEIMLLHIPRWGRITIPICVDYLVSEYRDILIKELKTTIMLCPSYSSGTIQFDNAASAGREFGVKTLWLNTCSALSNNKKISSIGFVSTPIITLDEKDTMTKEIIPTCSKCLESCLFTIDIQLKGNDVKKCNEVNIKHVPQ